MNDDNSFPADSDPGEMPPREGVFEEGARRYERQGLVGRGGMGLVYAARDTRLRRQVALKVAESPELAARLAREAWITAQLEHPGIVAVYDAGETDGQAWYTMRLIRGKTLRERLLACPDTASRLALLPHFHAACQAVAFAHAMGIVHRDLKPANILVGEFGETQVADWGLATPLDEARGHWQRIVGQHAAGTPRYMSPEQATGAAPGCASDVYGLGVVLYELLGGPAGETSQPELLPDTVARDLVAITRRCLQRDPAARYANAGELAEDLGRWLSGRRVRAHAYRPSELLARLLRVWRVPLTVAALALLVLTGVILAAVARTAQERAFAEKNLAFALNEQALSALRDDRQPEAYLLAAHALRFGPSPEARGILAATRRISTALDWQVELPERCRHRGVVSPDARSLVCRADGKLEFWSLNPMKRRAVLELPVVEEPVWVGERLLVATPDALVWIAGALQESTIPGSAWRPLVSGEVAFATRGPEARFLGADGGVLEFPICTATRATTLVAEDQLVVGCDDGFLRRYDRNGKETLSLQLGERPNWSAVEAVKGALLIGEFDGELRTLRLDDGTWSPVLKGTAARSLQAVPGTSAVLVLGERGGARIWNHAIPSWVGSLPAGPSRMFAGPRAGEVLLLGDTLQSWHIQENPRPTVFSYPTGVSQATPSPDGEALAVALGGGDVVESSLANGQELRRWHWIEGVVKGVAYGDEGRLVAAAMGANGQILGPSKQIQPITAVGMLRRMGRLSGGRVWLLSYTGSPVIFEVATGKAVIQAMGDGFFDGSSSPNGETAAVLEAHGGIWVLKQSTWEMVRQVSDAVAVDVGDGGTPIVFATRREVCVEQRCFPMGDDVIDVSVFGDRVAVAMLSGDIDLLEGHTGKELARLRGHTARASSVEFGPAGEWLVSGSWDGTARIWDLSGLEESATDLIERGEKAWGMGLGEAMRGK